MWGTSYWVTGVWVVAILSLGTNVAVSNYNVQVLINNNQIVSESMAVKRNLDDLLTDLLNMETGHRGFMITGRDTYLKPFEEGATNLPVRLTDLNRLFGDNPVKLMELQDVSTLMTAKQAEMNNSLQIYRTVGRDAAHEQVKTDLGKKLMDRVRVGVQHLVDQENVRLRERQILAEAKQRATVVTNLVGGALTIGMVAIAYVLVRRELNRRLNAEREARSSFEKFRTLTEAVPHIVWSANSAGNVESFNKQWQLYTGLTPEIGCGWGWLGAVHPEDKPKSEATWRQSLSSGKPFETEYRLRGEDGAYRWFLIRAVAHQDSRGRITNWYGTSTDIHDRKLLMAELDEQVQARTEELRSVVGHLRDEVAERVKTEDQLKGLTAELRRSNQELEQFAYVASHDLQEPLRKIQAFGDRLRTKYATSIESGGKEYLDGIWSSATRMRQLIDDLLTFSRISVKPVTFRIVALNTLLEEVISDLDVRIRQTEATIEVEPLPMIAADPVQMRQLFQNLLSNAIKFHRPGVPPVVQIRHRILDTESSCLPDSALVTIDVIDNGIGFDEKYLDRVFQMFQRLHSRDEYEGTGVGLAVCRKIVERHGGTITARTRPGEGAVFTVTLAASQAN